VPPGSGGSSVALSTSHYGGTGLGAL